MFFRDKVHISEVIKWGLFAGILQGLYIIVASIILAERQYIFSLASGWEHGASILLMSLIVVSAIITTVLVFAHPIFSLLKRHYRDAVFTIIVTLLTIIAISAFTVFAYPQLTNDVWDGLLSR